MSGSLQAASSNLLVLGTVADRLPAGTAFHVFASTGDLPAFNPDLDVEPAPEAVARWRAELAAADAVVVATPEYAHSYPGHLKNALDWVVGSGELVDKPVLLITAGPGGGVKAREALSPVLKVISSDLVGAISIAAVRQKYDGTELVDADALALVDQGLAALVAAASARSTPEA
ncbi:NAD(P)H-dependent oxidoreductase [Aquihabitans sp. G128]|uniref:NADPH-dependent FMN reductase n=1 Tax=Aquihabitans sp. G128 TaxID=2849779 RepID=UPI001C22EECF|nr:NADPH-dependent FMN reductase [Aquihabitans sp. G128]QXC59673.1 NAD(P)H-dependent oxidoreductase [Aquihabitans sp. G128]